MNARRIKSQCLKRLERVNNFPESVSIFDGPPSSSNEYWDVVRRGTPDSAIRTPWGGVPDGLIRGERRIG